MTVHPIANNAASVKWLAKKRVRILATRGFAWFVNSIGWATRLNASRNWTSESKSECPSEDSLGERRRPAWLASVAWLDRGESAVHPKRESLGMHDHCVPKRSEVFESASLRRSADSTRRTSILKPLGTDGGSTPLDFVADKPAVANPNRLSFNLVSVTLHSQRSGAVATTRPSVSHGPRASLARRLQRQPVS